MIRYATLEEAKRAVRHWDGDPNSVSHLGDRGNSVFSFNNQSGKAQILRFTDLEFRSLEEVEGELLFLNHLSASGVAVAACLPTLTDRLTYPFAAASGSLVCSSVAYAPGIEVHEQSPHWNEAFFQAWGRNLAHIHLAATQYTPPQTAPKRWQWDREILIAKAEELIPKEDTLSRQELREVISRCTELEKNSKNFGMIHADHAPQNFRYDPANKKITAFDFGNCCYHWFMADLAISLSTIRRHQECEKIRENILSGYAELHQLPPNYEEQIDLFIRLRVVYVYLSRLHLWSQNLNSDQELQLNKFRDSVHQKKGWLKNR